MQGQHNSSLNAVGRRQAEVHGRFLAACGIDAILASPLDRARQTVEIVRRFVRVEPVFDQRIMEWDCGEWSGHLRSEVKQRWRDEWAALEADPYHYRGPQCENYPDMITRAAPVVAELQANPARRIAIISHGMIGRIMVGILLGYGADQMLAFSQPNDVIYRVRLGLPGTSEPRLDRFVAGLGPFAGVVPR
jgi:broad specificity phosphatase PhoE